MTRVLILSLMLCATWGRPAAAQWEPAPPIDEPESAEIAQLRSDLEQYPHRIIFQSLRDGNWDLFIVNADGSEMRNLTNTPDVHEYFPKVSPDGSMIAFEASRPGREDYSEIWVMNIDGGERRLIDRWALQPAWSPDGRTLAYMRQPTPDSGLPYRMLGIMFHDMETGEITSHPNDQIRNFENLSYTRDGRWILGVISAAMGYGQSIIAVEADGTRHVNLIQQSRDLPPNPETHQFVMGCRPDVSPCGTRVTWAIEEKHTRMWIGMADLEFQNGEPRAVNWHWVATAPMEPTAWELYHPDWSPTGRFIAFSKGVRGPLMERARFAVRQAAPSWNICVVDPDRPGHYIQITTDGMSNKEPAWAPAAGGS